MPFQNINLGVASSPETTSGFLQMLSGRLRLPKPNLDHFPTLHVGTHGLSLAYLFGLLCDETRQWAGFHNAGA